MNKAKIETELNELKEKMKELRTQAKIIAANIKNAKPFEIPKSWRNNAWKI